MLEDLSRSHGKALHVWTSVEGLRRIAGARYVPPQDGTRDPVEALSAVRKLGEPSLVVFKDFHPFLSDPIVVRWRELAHHLKNTHTTLILLSPTLSIPVELEKEISVLDVPLPGFEDLKHLLVEIVQVVRKGNRTLVEIRATRSRADDPGRQRRREASRYDLAERTRLRIRNISAVSPRA